MSKKNRSHRYGSIGADRTGQPAMVPLMAAVFMLILVVVFSAMVRAGTVDGESHGEQLARALQALPEGVNDKTLSPFFFVFSENSDTDRLPLKSTNAKIKIAGVVADVHVSQVYKNEGRDTLEAVYIFPASTRAAVYSMRMTVGERIINAKIKKNAEARKDYEQAVAEGRTASLLEQKRPNVFQMSVGNILPGDEVKVELSYFEVLVPRDSTYQFVYPTVVGPRYTGKSGSNARPEQGWTHNPYLHQGEKPNYAFGLNLTLSSAMPIAAVSSPSHKISVEYQGKNKVKIGLENGEHSGNRDFVLRYKLAEDKIESGLLLFHGDRENFFLMMMEPPQRVHPEQVVQREYLFIQDVSGSMNGFPLDTSKELMKNLLARMDEHDYFNVLTFAGGNEVLSREPLEATSKNKRLAENWLNQYRGGGGTELLPALKRALSMPRTEGVSRIIVVITDGYVNVESEAFKLIRKNLGRANLFAFGIGSSVNRHLIEGMARAGMGEPFVILKPSEARAEAKHFADYVSSPLMRKIKIEFRDFEAYDVQPSAIPDLFAERPVMVIGKYRGEAEGSIVLSGETSMQTMYKKLEVKPYMESPDNSALRLLWARKKIRELADLDALGAKGDIKSRITTLGLAYGLLTAYTSFVAVDTEIRADGSKSVRVRQPLPMPQGVSDLAVGGMAGFGATRGAGRYKRASTGFFGKIVGLLNAPAAAPEPVLATGMPDKTTREDKIKEKSMDASINQVAIMSLKVETRNAHEKGIDRVARHSMERALSKVKNILAGDISSKAKYIKKVVLTVKIEIAANGAMSGLDVNIMHLKDVGISNKIEAAFNEAFKAARFPSSSSKTVVICKVILRVR
ncbi:MAG: VWA domain-containing protein [Deltaproteobacteria bacterium]|nr:VWA domain-containing protein [Deltaproteobacteria bacterium]